MRIRLLFLLTFVVAVLTAVTTAQAPAPAAASAVANGVHHEANFDGERAQANELYLAGKHVEALPLYEDLCRQDQTNPAFAERHGAGLLEKAIATADPQQKSAMNTEGIKELQRAESLGDTSPYVENMLGLIARTPFGVIVGGSMGALPLTVGYYYDGSPQARPLLAQGEAAFEQKDMVSALKFYAAAFAADPQYYKAALYAGDVSFRMKEYADCYGWFAKAIAIDPDRETAYRYWGDALRGAGDFATAKIKYEEAMAAEPYTRSTTAGLRNWIIQSNLSLRSPQVQRPQFPYHDGKFNDPNLGLETGDGRGSWLAYGQSRLAHDPHVVFNEWVMAGVVEKNPQLNFVPNGYVHTLSEEVDAIDALLADVQKKLAAGVVTQEKLDPGIKNLMALKNDHMLEPFIFISFNDAGIRHGYPEYRAAHREQVVAYIDRYIIGPPLPQGTKTPYVNTDPK